MYCNKTSRILSFAVASIMILGTCAFSGCQVSIGGQTLPSGHYLRDDIDFHPAGPEFKLEQEAAALRAARVNAQANQ